MEKVDRERLQRGIQLLEENRITLLFALSTGEFFHYLLTGDEEDIFKLKSRMEE
jgi:hypothetical protein